MYLFTLQCQIKFYILIWIILWLILSTLSTEIITTLSSEPLINKSIQRKKTKQKKETDHDKVFVFAEDLWVFSLFDRV